MVTEYKPDKLVEIQYLYYDMDEEYNPIILNDPKYNQQLRVYFSDGKITTLIFHIKLLVIIKRIVCC